MVTGANGLDMTAVLVSFRDGTGPPKWTGPSDRNAVLAEMVVRVERRRGAPTKRADRHASGNAAILRLRTGWRRQPNCQHRGDRNTAQSVHDTHSNSSLLPERRYVARRVQHCTASKPVDGHIEVVGRRSS